MSQNLLNNNPEFQPLSLKELSEGIRDTIRAGFPGQVWVTAEISEFRVHRSGHAYLDLIEKDPDSDAIHARIRATIWSFTYRILRPFFEGSTGYKLSSGIKVLVSVSIEYHPQYGLSLNIKDIDPNYTLGDLARKKAEIIKKLKEDGVFDMNRELSLATVPQNIAVISSESAAGFGDFTDTLNNNSRNYRFNLTLFPALMQGEKAADSIIKALERIFNTYRSYDAVIIIRGGGASIELECFNHYDLAFHIAQFPLPVITGIGHERDETIADLVAWRSLKTPTATAEFLIDRFLDFEENLMELQSSIHQLTAEKLRKDKEKLANLSRSLYLVTTSELKRKEYVIREMSHLLKSQTFRLILNHRSRVKEFRYQLRSRSRQSLTLRNLSLVQIEKSIRLTGPGLLRTSRENLGKLEKMVNLLNPRQILKRGYSITRKNGKTLKNDLGLMHGDILETTLYQGKLESKVIKDE